jgi:hypothetical protein
MLKARRGAKVDGKAKDILSVTANRHCTKSDFDSRFPARLPVGFGVTYACVTCKIQVK